MLWYHIELFVRNAVYLRFTSSNAISNIQRMGAARKCYGNLVVKEIKHGKYIR